MRYGRNENSQPYGADPMTPPSGWGTSGNNFNSFNVNHNWVLGGSKLNEFIFQYADFSNAHRRQQHRPDAELPERRHRRPERQHAADDRSRRSVSSATTSRGILTGMGGLGHDMKAGVNYIHEPPLFITFNTGTNDYTYNHLDNDLNGPLSTVTRNGGAAEANIPLESVRVLRSGRLAGEQPADAEPRPAL